MFLSRLQALQSFGMVPVVQGAKNPQPLNLTGATLGTPFWPSVIGSTDNSGNLTIVPFTTITIPGNNATSKIIFVFDSKYDNLNGKESISLTLSDAACQGITIKNK